MLLPLMTIMNYHENYRGEHGHQKKITVPPRCGGTSPPAVRPAAPQLPRVAPWACGWGSLGPAVTRWAGSMAKVVNRTSWILVFMVDKYHIHISYYIYTYNWGLKKNYLVRPRRPHFLSRCLVSSNCCGTQIWPLLPLLDKHHQKLQTHSPKIWS